MSGVKSNKFYWLKLNENFFESKELRVIEQSENGKEIALFYVKLLLIAINNEGRLILEDRISFTFEMLADMTLTNREIARQGMDIFFYLGLIRKLEDGTFYMTKLGDMVGSETSHAAKKRKQRDKKDDKGENEGFDKKDIENAVLTEKSSEVNEKKKTKSNSSNKKFEKKKDNVQQSIENRDKSIEIREESLDKKQLQQQKEEGEAATTATADKETYFNIAKKLEQCNFGLPSSHMVNKLLVDVEIYGEKFVSDAIELADEYGVRKYPYVKSVLEKWKTNGRGGKGFGRDNKKNNGKNYDEIYDFSKYSEGSGEAFDGEDIETEY